MNRFILGIDIGGTQVKLGLVDARGRISCRTIFPTKSFARSKNKLIGAIVDAAAVLFKERNLRTRDMRGIGIGVPGLVDVKKGVVRTLTNIPKWHNVPLKAIMEKKLGIATCVDNDVNLITLAEWQYGAGRGYRDFVCLTLGTGVGGGLVLDNQLYRGAGYAAGEIGHIPLAENGARCNCGGLACLERSIGNKYLLQKARRIFKDTHITLEEVTRLAGRGNKKARAFWQEAAVHLGGALTAVVNMLNPQCIVIGGGVANAYRYLVPGVRATLHKRAMKVPGRMVAIAKAQLAHDAGILGAHVLVRNSLNT